MRYPEEDLFGYPDTLARSRLGAAYLNACSILRTSNPQSALDIGSYHGHGVKTIAEELESNLVVSSDELIHFLEPQQRVLNRKNGHLPYKQENPTFLKWGSSD